MSAFRLAHVFEVDGHGKVFGHEFGQRLDPQFPPIETASRIGQMRPYGLGAPVESPTAPMMTSSFALGSDGSKRRRTS
jgi:hypothetical protein